MTTFMATDTQRRFLGAITERVQLERLQELYLFTPLRQGGVETGVAVVAVTQAEPTAEQMAEPADVGAVPDATLADGIEPDAIIAEQTETATESETELATDELDPRCDPTEAAAQDDVVTDAPPPRCTVITARYRLQLKGPERGKWEMDIVEEADAPLVTVDAVVRGVQRRVGDAAEVERLDGADVAAFLSDPAWPRTT